MKTQISFMTSLFKSGIRMQDADSDRLLGEDLALWFAGRSKDGEFAFGKPVQGDTGWSESASAVGEEFTLGFEIVHASVGSEYAEWKINIGKAGRMFGAKDSEIRSRLCDHVHNVLRDSRHVREIQWAD